MDSHAAGPSTAPAALRRPPWFDPQRTADLARRLSDQPDLALPPENVLPVGWVHMTMSRPPPSAAVPVGFEVVERPSASREEVIASSKKRRKAKRASASCNTKVDPAKTDRRVFALRIRPTTAQKRLFQRAFSIACLAKRLAYKFIGDQRDGITKTRLYAIKQAICTENIQSRERVNPDDPEDKRMRIVKRTENTTLPPATRRILFEQRLPKGDRLISSVRTNAVIQFCHAINATKALVEEKTINWDRAAQAHERYLMMREDTLVPITTPQTASASTPTAKRRPAATKRKRGNREDTDEGIRTDRYGVARMWTCRHPPRGDRPEMRPRQVKPPDRNRPRHSFSVDAHPRKTNPDSFTVRWDSKECRDNSTVVFMRQKVALWGCPSKRKRQLDRLTARMPNGEQASRTQTTLRYADGRYHLMIQCLSDKVPPRDRRPVRAVALDPGVRTFMASYDTDGRFGTVGDGQIGRIIKVAKRADRIKSHIDTRLVNQGFTNDDDNKARRKRARKRARQLNAKCRDLKADAHWKTARALCQRYDHILLPKFNSRAASQALDKTTTRQMLHWSHYEFRQRLQHKAEATGARVHLVSEHYSSMTCGRCLYIEESFRKNGSKRFECRNCGYAIDRDANGARNILIMNAERYIGRLEVSPLGSDAVAID
ncbi:Transposase [Pandoravirus dulcis]|uniref:Transposase n=1 Tax=Pandoravirus dulcis TaxID=1349409 RepID=S4VZ68_9VIRU|nr:transposase [Pandoravirus dulcis]AGO83341.1 Transposase [Pandoravirus dulcis]